jgi:hypothetical protein
MLAGGSIASFIGVMANIKPIMELPETVNTSFMEYVAEGKIYNPMENAAVPSKVTFEGKAKMPKNGSLWLFIYASGIEKYYPYEIDPNLETGKWRLRDTEIGLESDYQRSFKAELVLLNEKNSTPFREKVRTITWKVRRQKLKERGMENKPDGKTLATVNIVRAPH